jgi:hypothetical protein
MRFRRRKKTIPDITDFILGCDFADRKIKVDETVISELIKGEGDDLFLKGTFPVTTKNKRTYSEELFRKAREAGVKVSPKADEEPKNDSLFDSLFPSSYPCDFIKGDEIKRANNFREFCEEYYGEPSKEDVKAVDNSELSPYELAERKVKELRDLSAERGFPILASLIPLVRSRSPVAINDLFKVQPMTAPVKGIFYWDYKFKSGEKEVEKMDGERERVSGHRRPENNRKRLSESQVRTLEPIDPVLDALYPGNTVVFIAGQHYGEVYAVESFEMEMSETGVMSGRVKLDGLASPVYARVLARYDGPDGNQERDPFPMRRYNRESYSVQRDPFTWELLGDPSVNRQIAFYDEDGDRREFNILQVLDRIAHAQATNSKKMYDTYMEGARMLAGDMLSNDGVSIFPGFGAGKRAMLFHLVAILEKERLGVDRMDPIMSVGQLLEGDEVVRVVVDGSVIRKVSGVEVVVGIEGKLAFPRDNRTVLLTGGHKVKDSSLLFMVGRPGKRACPNKDLLGSYNWGVMSKVRWKGFYYEIDREIDCLDDDIVDTFSPYDVHFISGIEDDVNRGLKFEDGIDEAFITSYVEPEKAVEGLQWDPYGLGYVSEPRSSWPTGGHPARVILERSSNTK